VRRETAARNAEKDQRLRVALRQEHAMSTRTHKLKSKRRANGVEKERLHVHAGSRFVADDDVPEMIEKENTVGEKGKRGRGRWCDCSFDFYSFLHYLCSPRSNTVKTGAW
jgi:hypothetical protein